MGEYPWPAKPRVVGRIDPADGQRVWVGTNKLGVTMHEYCWRCAVDWALGRQDCEVGA